MIALVPIGTRTSKVFAPDHIPHREGRLTLRRGMDREPARGDTRARPDADDRLAQAQIPG